MTDIGSLNMRLMTNNSPRRFILPFLLWFCSPAIHAGYLHHDLQVSLDPEGQRLTVTDRLQLPQAGPAEFLLHSGLDPATTTPGAQLISLGPAQGQVSLTAYRITLPAHESHFSLSYGGVIAHDFSTLRESPGRQRQQLAGTISPQGTYLDGASGWYPYFPGALQTFDLQVDLPEGWLAVSQGAGPAERPQPNGVRVSWRETTPQDEIYLVASPYQCYRRKLADGVEAQVFLHEPDDGLAQRYLAATATYLDLYGRLIGPYPYAKFALVENFWETGYGMPSFTLLGPQVLRLPFILNSSYPHEILHNWWGNSVYVDYASGNWSEGLTNYLADHLIAEQQGKGVDYRRTALQRYGDFVRGEADFPLSEFRGRHSMASQAVGYDKGLMLFHMLRRQLGDETFIEGLRRFYRDNRFKTAGYAQLQAAFEAVSGQSLGDFFRQWTQRTGAPALSLQSVSVKASADGFRLTGQLTQTQREEPFRLLVPLVVTQRDGSTLVRQIEMTQRTQPFTLDLSVAPVRLSVDPWFDLFRQLDPAETAPSLGGLFGADRISMVLPAAADPALLAGYRQLAKGWAADYPQAEIVTDDQLKTLPTDRAVLLLGWENRFLDSFLQGLKGYPLQRHDDDLTLAETPFDRQDHSFALAKRSPDHRQTQVWIGSTSVASLPGLARKLPHYGKYSALAFEGEIPENRLKLQWPVIQSPLQVDLLPGEPFPPPTPPAPLIDR